MPRPSPNFHLPNHASFPPTSAHRTDISPNTKKLNDTLEYYSTLTSSQPSSHAVCPLILAWMTERAKMEASERSRISEICIISFAFNPPVASHLLQDKV